MPVQRALMLTERVIVLCVYAAHAYACLFNYKSDIARTGVLNQGEALEGLLFWGQALVGWALVLGWWFVLCHRSGMVPYSFRRSL